MLIRIDHPELGPQMSYLTAESASAATTSTVENNDGLSSGVLVLFGKLGEEKSEIVILTSASGVTTIGHSAGLDFAHPARTPLFEMAYNQVEVSRASSQGGSYSVLTTIDLDVDEPKTTYNDTSGNTTHWYKIRYYNSQSASYSDYSSEVQGTGYTEDSLRALTDEVLEEYGDSEGEELTRKRVAAYLRSGVRKLTTDLIKTFPDWRTAYTTQQLTASTATYDLPDYFLAFKRVDVNFSSNDPTNAYKADYIGEEHGYPQTTYVTSEPKVFLRGSVFGLRPTPTSSSGYAYIWYWTHPADMSGDDDEHGLPYGAKDLLVAWALYRAYLPKDSEKAGDFRRMYNDLLPDYIEFVAQTRQAMTRKKVDIIFGDDLYED